MNGIRLIVACAAALFFLQADSADLTAQTNRGEAYSNAYGGRGMGPGTAPKQNTRGRQQDQPMGAPPGGIPADGGRTSRSKSQSSRSSNSRRSRSRTSSRSNNAIESNPLFKYLDTNGDGELSLEEIDAASRMLYNLDTDEDDRITSDEVEDMAVAGDSGSQDRGSSRTSSRPSSRSSASRSRGSTPRGPGGAVGGDDRGGRGTGRATGKAGMQLGIPGAGGAAPGGGNAAPDEDFAAHDSNNDGVLKRSEMPRAYRSKFTKMDANRDSEVDEDEWYDFIDSQ